MSREIAHRYVDPLSHVWRAAAAKIGLRITRTRDAYATTDGRGTMALADDADLDPDDSLGQMIFHELCHSLVEGPDSFARADWGFTNGPDEAWREHACLRTQWVLAGRHGLRTLFAPTTDFRTTFWNTLSGDVLADRTDRSTIAAIHAVNRAAKHPWAPALDEALRATAQIAAATAPFAHAADSLWRPVETAPHPSGLPAGARGTCGTCHWRYEQRGRVRCRQLDAAHEDAKQRAVDPAWSGCERFEDALDCLTCGACCREAYQAVHVKRRDPVRKKQPSYIVDRVTYLEVLREGDRCAALQGQGPYHCVIYDDRPQTCREFTLGSDHCLTARRRVGLSL